MSPGTWNDVLSVLEDAVGPGRVAPAATLLVGRGDAILFEHSFGLAGTPGHEHACDADTIFDLASLTKPLVTAVLVLDLIASGKINFDTIVADLLPAFAEGGDERRRAVTIRDLLRHDSGLPAHRRYYESFDPSAGADDQPERRARMFALAVAEPLERDPRSGSVYSDIGFLVLGAIVEELAGSCIARLARERVLEPLGIDEARFIDTGEGLDPARAARCARTGVCDWRRREIHAIVQDENAFAMGGVASHAGLFATARDVHRLAAEWVAASAGRGRVLDRRVVGHAWNRAASAAGAAPSTWALGWDTPTPGLSSAGERVGATAVGHLGYTGTSIWIDPTRGAHVVLLTNRIAHGRSSEAIRTLRPKVHDAVFAALDRKSGVPAGAAA